MKLTSRITALLLTVTMLAVFLPVTADTPNDFAIVMNNALARIADTVHAPSFGTTSGEWSVLALARSGYETESGYFEGYYERIVDTVSKISTKPKLHNSKSTENSRLILALTSIGRDAANVGGVDLTAPLDDLAWVNAQGVNGSIYALIALDSGNYGTEIMRDKLIEDILSKEISGGGFSLSGAAPASDMTAMALQALAPYKDDAEIDEVIERGLAKLSAMQAADGSFGTMSENIAQVIVALTALGIDPTTDTRFIKSGNNPVSALIKFAVTTGGFKSTASQTTANLIATDQGAYALVAYHRFTEGQNSLYDMSDVFPSVIVSCQEDNTGFTVNRIRIPITADLSEQYDYADAFEGEKLSAMDALVALHIIAFGDDKAVINDKLKLEQYDADGYSGVMVTSFMGDDVGNMLYYINGATVWDGVTQKEIESGDIVEFFSARDAAWGDLYGYFKYDGERVDRITVAPNQEITLEVAAEFTDWADTGDTFEIPIVEADIVEVVPAIYPAAEFVSLEVKSDEDGNFDYTFEDAGTYVLSAVEKEGDTPLMAPYLVVKVTDVNKLILNDLITEANKLNSANYTAVTWDVFAAALSSAKAVSADTNATQAQVDDAITALLDAIDNLKAPSGTTPPVNPDVSFKVSFRLIGSTRSTSDVDLAKNNYKNAKYVTWLATKNYTVYDGDTMYDLFTDILDDASMAYIIDNGNYVSSITSPSVLGSYRLNEFSNGPYSGWQYTVNGVHVSTALSDYVLKSGDKIIWHYVNDYRYETEIDGDFLGDGRLINKWLEADDRNPTSSDNATEITNNNSSSSSSSNSYVAPVIPEPVIEEQPLFSDVVATDWFYDAVEYVSDAGLMKGTGKGFEPYTELTRAMLVTILHRVEGEPQGGAEYIDVDSNEWYAAPIAWAGEHGIINGYGSGVFGPDDNITREQFAVILYNYAVWKGLDVYSSGDLAGFSDIAEVSDWAEVAIRWAVGSDLMRGRTEDTLAPAGTTLRAEAAVLLMRFMENV